MADVAYRSNDTGTGATLTAPGATQTGDLMVAIVAGFGSVGVPTGWTEIGTALAVNITVRAAYRVRQSGDTTYSSTNCSYWQMGVWSGGHQTDPVVDSSFATHTANVNIPLPSLTASTIAGDAAAYSIMGEGGYSFTEAANYTERLDNVNSQTIGDRTGLTESQSTSGTVVISSIDNCYVLHLIARSSNTGGASRNPVPMGFVVG